MALDEIWQTGLGLLVGVVVLWIVREPSHLLLVSGGLLAGPVLSALLGLLGGPEIAAYAAANVTFGRLAGGTGDANQLAAGLVSSLPLAVGILVCARPTWIRALAAGTIPITVIGLAATQSRGGALALLVVLVLMVALVRGARGLALATAGVALVAGAAYLGTTPQALERLRAVDANGTGRMDLWNIAWSMAQANPFGVGLGGFRAEAAAYVHQPGLVENIQLIVDRPVVAHNTFLELLAETGWIGLALFLGVVVGSLASALAAARRFDRMHEPRHAIMARTVGVALLGFMVSAAFISMPFGYRTWAFLALGPALLTVASRADAHAGPVARGAAS